MWWGAERPLEPGQVRAGWRPLQHPAEVGAGNITERHLHVPTPVASSPGTAGRPRSAPRRGASLQCFLANMCVKRGKYKKCPVVPYINPHVLLRAGKLPFYKCRQSKDNKIVYRKIPKPELMAGKKTGKVF